MKVLLTGAHFTPAQAVIEELLKGSSLKDKAPDIEIVYVGRKYTMEGDKSLSAESQVLPKLGVKFIPIIAGRIRRSVDFYTLLSLLKIPIGLIQSFLIVLKEKPDVVVSFGGYVGVPVVISAWLLSIPVIIHEQALIPGLANSISSFFADKIAVTFDKRYPYPKEKVVLTGNPIRNEILEPDSSPSEDIKRLVVLKKREKLPLIYITGGNQGAHFINEKVAETLNELNKRCVIIHQTGDSKFADYERLKEKNATLKFPDRYLVQKWVDAKDVGFVYKNADFCISRAGANTLLELSLWGIPTLIIPLPNVLRNEQIKNASFFKQAGLGEVLNQSSLTAEKFITAVESMIKGKDVIKKQAAEARKLVVLDASKKLVIEILTLTKNVF